MDFTNRGPLGPNSSAQDINVSKPSSSRSSKFGRGDWSHTKLYKIAISLLSLCVLVVVVGLLAFLFLADWSNNSESSYIQTSKLQAIFLNTGQVYFGNITHLNNNYVVLTNIFYLQTANNGSSGTTSSPTSPTSPSSSSSTNNTVTLVKLGCEIHAPLDQMVINRSSVTFWENLSPSGQVAKAVRTWEKDNPNGQKCSDQSTAGTSGQNTPQNATNNASSSTTTNSTPATKP